MKPKICRNKFMKTKAKRQMLKTKVMIFEAKNAKWIWKIIRRRRAIDSIQNSSGQLGN